MIQSLAENKVHASDKHTFFGTLRRLAGKHARLPESMVIRDEIDFSAPSQPHTSGGFADIKQGQYKGHTVAVKKLRVAETDNFDKIRRVSRNEIFVVGCNDTDYFPAIQQRGHPLEFAIPPECSEASRRPGWHRAVSVCDGVGVDGPRKHHAVHQGHCHEQVGSGSYFRV